MKKIFAVCVLSLFTLTACQGLQTMSVGEQKRSLENVELKYPDITVTFPSGETYRSGDSFIPPKTIDCSCLRLKPDAFKDAIDKGALVMRMQTPRQVKTIVQDKDGKEITQVVKIKPVYGGVLALCKVSDRATGPDSRSYRIRGLDNYLAKGKDGLISVVGAVLDYKAAEPNIMEEWLQTNGISQSANSTNYSWMLWLTDRTATFTDYEAEVSKNKASKTP